MSSLAVQGLCVSYGRTEALRGIDLAVPAGQVVCLIGANGAGKTTTMRALSGLVRPRAGQIRLDGADITGQRPHCIAAAGLLQVPEGRQVFAELTVAENLAIGAWLVSDRAEIARRQDEVLTRFPRLRERLDQLAGSMSGGEQQMLALGMALMTRPKLLLLDEPSTGLAPVIVRNVMDRLRDVNARFGTGLIVVEQNVPATLKLVDRAIIVKSGAIAFDGSAQELAGNKDLWRWF